MHKVDLLTKQLDSEVLGLNEQLLNFRIGGAATITAGLGTSSKRGGRLVSLGACLDLSLYVIFSISNKQDST